MRVPLADGTLVKLPVAADSALIPSLLTLSDVFGTGYHAAVKAGVKPGDTVTVIGDGAVGLLAVLSASRLGAERIILMGRHRARTDLGREFGATDVVAERGEEGIAQVRELTGGARHPGSCSKPSATCPPTNRPTASSAPAGSSAVSASPSTRTHPSASAASSAATSPSPAAPHPHAPTSRNSCPTSSKAAIEPGKVFDRTVDLDDVPDGYRAMAQREALKVLVRP